MSSEDLKRKHGYYESLGEKVARGIMGIVAVATLGAIKPWPKTEWDDSNGGGGDVQREVDIPSQIKPTRSSKLGRK